MAQVNIFVSSTCYDLSQIRHDIKQCILDLGHNPIFSEMKNFPIDPNLSSSENCINTVQSEADIFILIIGDHYGSVLESGKSITNTEFLTAVNKGIPIYTFALKKMITLLPLWEKNPDADFSNEVDDNRIFKFLSEIRKDRRLWNFEFEKAQDIADILRSQLSILFHDALKIKLRFEGSTYNDLFSKISSKAANIIIKKEDYYEVRFFMQSMDDEIQSYSYLKNDYNYSVLLGAADRINDVDEIMNWLQCKFGQMLNYIESLNKLVGAFKKYYAEPGCPSDLEGLHYVARSFGKLYRSVLEWGIEVKSIILPEEYDKLRSALADLPSNIIDQIENYPKESLKKINESLAKHNNGELGNDSVVSLKLLLTMNDDALNRYYEEFEVVKRSVNKKYGSLMH